MGRNTNDSGSLQAAESTLSVHVHLGGGLRAARVQAIIIQQLVQLSDDYRTTSKIIQKCFMCLFVCCLCYVLLCLFVCLFVDHF